MRAPRRAGPRAVTVSSDLGSVYAAQVRAVLLASLPTARVIDLTHDLRPHELAEAAFVLAPVLSRFAAGAVHLVVVDPGVGGRRQPVVVACRNGSWLVGADNGLIGALAEGLGGGRAFRLDPARVPAAPRVGTTFDGRDLFAPAAVALALGVAPEDLGRPTRLRPLATRPPRRLGSGAEGSVSHIDRFGNVLTDIPEGWVPRGARELSVRLRGAVQRAPWVRSYEEGAGRRLVAIGSSFGTVELAVARGRAADRLRLSVGARVRLAWKVPARLRGRPNRK